MALPPEIKDFEKIGADGLSVDHRGYINSKILGIEVRDKEQRVKARPLVGIWLAALLTLQNSFLIIFVWKVTKLNNPEDFSVILSIICPATLVETAAFVHTMVKWIFSDVEYKTH